MSEPFSNNNHNINNLNINNSPLPPPSLNNGSTNYQQQLHNIPALGFASPHDVPFAPAASYSTSTVISAQSTPSVTPRLEAATPSSANGGGSSSGGGWNSLSISNPATSLSGLGSGSFTSSQPPTYVNSRGSFPSPLQIPQNQTSTM